MFENVGREPRATVAELSQVPAGSPKQKGALSIREQVAEVMRINESAKQATKDGQFQKVRIPSANRKH